MFTFAQLKAAVLEQAFPDKEAKNLFIPHEKIMISAVVEIQQAIDRYKHNNTEIIPFCATYFQCGLTVLQAPRGIINGVSTFSGITTQCIQQASPINWCDEVKYQRVDYSDLVKMIDRTLACSCSGFNGYSSLLNLPFATCQKVLGQKYSPPTDAEYCGFPTLPLGFHFAQDSTDMNRRARVGVWALQHNRIYIGPWINSTETVVVEWDGLKRQWVNADWVDTEEDPLFIDAVKHYLLMKHFGQYERDPQMEAYHRDEFYGNDAKGLVGALPKLYYQHREETRTRNKRETNSHSMMSGKTLEEQTSGTNTACVTTTTTTCALPSAPNNLVADIDNVLGVTLAWTPGNGSGMQQIWRSDNGGALTLLADVPSASGFYVDGYENLIGGHLYCYQIRGANSCGFSEFCAEDCVSAPS